MSALKSLKSKRSLPQIPPPSNDHHTTSGISKENVEPNVDVLPEGFKTPTLKSKLLRQQNTPECYTPVQMDGGTTTYTKNILAVAGKNPATLQEDSFSVTVAVRVRPLSQREKEKNDTKCIVKMRGNETIVVSTTGITNSFVYDYSFWSFDRLHGDFACQETVYNKMGRPLLDSAFQGYNVCLFAYGQTGSGKSYSVMGESEEQGIVPRFSQELFHSIENPEESGLNHQIEISYFEIYNEKIHDLLVHSMDKGKRKASLRVREHPTLGPYVEGLSTFVARSFQDITDWLVVGNKQRATASTGMNDKSSRSHSVFTIVMTRTKTEFIEGEKHEHSRTSRINLVDLAGSERSASAQTSGDRLKEGASINKSLLTLGKVISQLSEKSITKRKRVFVPYRDSVLTWLLKESLGGNSKTAMLATISPASSHFEETLSTLRYAKTARSIINIAKVNEDPNARLIRDLRAEIEKLKNQKGDGNFGVSETEYQASLSEIAALKEKLTESETKMVEVTKTWKERLEQSERRKAEESKELQKAGVSLKVDNKLPNLVNLNEDPQLSEVLVYMLKEGQSRVGHLSQDSDFEIQLSGALVNPFHCTITNTSNVIRLEAKGDSETYINGDLVTNQTTLHHGDRVVIGGHYFRFNHPMQVKKVGGGARKSMAGVRVDFEYARDELATAQNAKLEAELEAAKLKAHQEMMLEIESAKEAAQVEMNHVKSDYESKISHLQVSLEKQSLKRKEEEKHKQQAKVKIEELEEQKRMLEQELLTNRKRLQMEALAAQQGLDQNKRVHSSILDALESEKHNLEKDVERLKNREHSKVDPATKSRRDLLKLSMWLQEANNISRSLKKNTVFARFEEIEGDEVTFKIKVTNSKLKIATFWTLEKFEERILQMRELYQQGASLNDDDDDVFYDPNDDWQKEDNESPKMSSPRILNGLRTPTKLANLVHYLKSPLRSVDSQSTGSSSSGNTVPSSVKLGFLTEAVADPGTPGTPTSPERQSPGPAWPAVQIAHLCRGLVSQAMERLGKPTLAAETIVDSILQDLQRLKSSIESLNTERGVVDQQGCLEASVTVELLASHVTVWSSYHSALNSGLVRDLTEQMIDTTKKTAGNLVKILQGCENAIESMVSESHIQILQSISFLARVIGELAIATEAEVASLTSDYYQRYHDQPEYLVQLDSDIRQAFQDGADVFIDRTLQGGIKTVVTVDEKIVSFATAQEPKNKFVDSCSKQCKLLVSMVKLLLMKCQDLQIDLASAYLEGADARQCSYYVRSYQRAQSMVTEVSGLVDFLGTIPSALTSLNKGQRGELRKLKRNLESALRMSIKLSAVASRANMPWSGQDDQSEFSDMSSLSSETSMQTCSQVELAAGQVKSVAGTLIDLVDRQVEAEQASSPFNTPTKGKRLLPPSPEPTQLSRIRKRLSVADSVDYEN